jgi:hypothetical protein
MKKYSNLPVGDFLLKNGLEEADEVRQRHLT